MVDHKQSRAELLAEIRALRSHARELELTLQATTDGIWKWDYSTHEVVFSDRYYTMLGYKPGEIAPSMEAWQEFIHPEDLEHTLIVADQFMASQPERYNNEFRMRTKSGEYRWIRSRGAVVDRDDQGQPLRLIGNHSDVTELRQAVEDLRYQKLQTQQYLDVADVMLVALDVDQRVTLINPAGCEILGYEEAEILGQNWFDRFIPGDDTDEIKSVFDRIIAGDVEPVNSYKNPVMCSDGSQRWMAWHNSILRDHQGQIIGLFSSGEDITQIRASESRRESLEDQLHHSQKMEAIGLLAGGVAHDFNNLLTVINNHSELAAEGLHDEDPLKDDLRQILEAGERAAGLTRQLLAFSRKQVLAPEILDVNQVVVGLEKMLHRLIGEDILFRTSLDEELGKVRADPGQLEQILMNLVVNARDAMPTGGKLVIQTANVELDDVSGTQSTELFVGPQVMLSVSDSGAGMTEDVRKRVFEPFFTTKKEERGTGLGLSIVHGIVKQSGGEIRVESVPGQGTTFRVYLPVTKDDDSLERPMFPSTALRGDETILVVEDERSVRSLVHRMLTNAGYRVISAANGGEAILECERHEYPIQLVITDVVMPKMSGKQLAARLLEIHPELKVLYMSGYTNDALGHYGVLDEGTLLVAKPFKMDELLNKVRQALGDAGGG